MKINKEEKLRVWMRTKRGVLVAYSGGVDSAYLALIATQELGPRAVCLTGVSPSVSHFQLETARRIAETKGFEHRLLNTFELEEESYRLNEGNRCYFCKTELYERIRLYGESEFPGYVIVDGSNADDIKDHRPGRIAAKEKGIHSPLEEFGFSKKEVREFSRSLSLETWDMPASPCLSSRVAIGVPVTIERLSKIERGEAVLRRMGFREFRLRVLGDAARIEISADEMNKVGFEEIIDAASTEIKDIGFRKVFMNPIPFRSGSLNEVGGVRSSGKTAFR